MESLKIYSTVTNEMTPSVKEDHVMAQSKCRVLSKLSSSKTRLYFVSLDYYSHFYSFSLEMNPSDTEAVHWSVHAACLLAIKL